MAYGLSAALSSEPAFNKDRVVQYNLPDYTVIRMNQTPKFEVHLAIPTHLPTGTGTPATLLIAHALANAPSAATGQHFDGLPLRRSA